MQHVKGYLSVVHDDNGMPRLSVAPEYDEIVILPVVPVPSMPM